jgi:hypothetical protein
MGEMTSAQRKLLEAIIHTADEHKNPGGVYIKGRERRTVKILQRLGLVVFNGLRSCADPTTAGRLALSPTQKKGRAR